MWRERGREEGKRLREGDEWRENERMTDEQMNGTKKEFRLIGSKKRYREMDLSEYTRNAD